MISRMAHGRWLVGLMLCFGGLGGLGACTPPRPPTPTTLTVQAEGGVRYALPHEGPRGSLELVSYGAVVVMPRIASGGALHALHVRAILSNGSPADWVFDVREQRLYLEGRGVAEPSFAAADAGDLPPLLTVPVEKRRVVDLFYVLPLALQDATTLPGFDVAWALHLGSRIVSERVSFELLLASVTEPFAAFDYGTGYYWAPPYWEDPTYPLDGFRLASGLPSAWTGQPLVIFRLVPHAIFRRR